MPLKIWASKLHDWSWSHGSIRTPSFVINLARKTINNPKPHNFYFYFILTPYNWVGNGNGKAEVVIAGSVTIMAVPHRRGRVVGLQVQPDHRGWGRGQVVGLQVELDHAANQGAGSVSVRYSTVASAFWDGDPVVDLWPLFFKRHCCLGFKYLNITTITRYLISCHVDNLHLADPIPDLNKERDYIEHKYNTYV